MKNLIASLFSTFLFLSSSVFSNELTDSISADYDSYLADQFDYFHRNPELSLLETKTAARMAGELRRAGYDVTEGVGGTGVVAMMKNGDGPLVMMRADMDGLPIEEKTGLAYASKVIQEDPITGLDVPVMHACGHDVHITSLLGTARQMAKRKNQWSGTLMLIVQPAEERVLGAKAMHADGLWDRFGLPDYALGFHVTSNVPSGKIAISEGSPLAGVDTVDIIIHGVGTHGAYPHRGKDPIVLGSQIVLALQTLVSRELPPRDPGVVTVGSFHSGTKHNIISDEAHLQLTVRNTSLKTRETLLNGIRRIAENMGRAAGLPENKLPEVIVSDEWSPPVINDTALVRQLSDTWAGAMGAGNVLVVEPTGMGGEDFPFFTTDPAISSIYWAVGGTPAQDFELEAAGGTAVPGHHSPLFKITPESSVRTGVESTVVALLELMPN